MTERDKDKASSRERLLDLAFFAAKVAVIAFAFRWATFGLWCVMQYGNRCRGFDFFWPFF